MRPGQLTGNDMDAQRSPVERPYFLPLASLLPNLKLSSLNSFSRSCAAKPSYNTIASTSKLYQAIISTCLVISVEVVPYHVEALQRCVASHVLRFTSQALNTARFFS